MSTIYPSEREEWQWAMEDAVRTRNMARNCDCHPWSDEDERIWKIVKNQPHTKGQWQALHDAIEGFRRLLIEDYKRAQTEGSPDQ